MASARQKNGKWYYRITITVGDGTHKYIERGGYKTKREALIEGNKVEVSYKEGETVQRPKTITFAALQNLWRATFKGKYKKRTIEMYSEALDIDLVPRLGNYTMDAIEVETLQRIIDELAEKRVSRARLDLLKTIMSNVFSFAVSKGYIKENIVRRVTIPAKRSEIGRQLHTFNHTFVMPKEEIDAIFKRFPEGHPSFIPLLLGYRCGLRKSEAFGLFIDDVDTKNKVIHVRRQLLAADDGSGYYFTSLKWKNPGEERLVYLDSDTNRILARHIRKIIDLSLIVHYPVYRIDQNGYLSLKEGEPCSPINVRYSDGTFVAPSTMHSTTKVIQGKKSYIDYVDPHWDFHCLRHTHASECIAAGMDPVSLANRLGHVTVATTYKYYVHETITQVTNAKDILEKMYS